MNTIKELLQRNHWGIVTLTLMLSLCFFNHAEAQVLTAVILMYILFSIQ